MTRERFESSERVTITEQSHDNRQNTLHKEADSLKNAGALKLLSLLIPCLTIPSSISSAPALSTETGASDVEAADVATDVATDVAWLPWLRREFD